MYILHSAAATYDISLPTSFNEITNENLKKIAEKVELKPHYVLLALVYKTSLFNLAAQVANGNKNDTISITPLVIKAGDTTHLPVEKSELIRPIIAPSVIERGYEVFIPTVACVNSVLAYISNDNDLRTSLVQKNYTGNLKANNVDPIDNRATIVDNSTPVFIMGFKIVAENDIVATVPLNQSIDDIYRQKVVRSM